MKEFHDIEEALLDYADGTCRDVNFEGATWEGVTEFLKSLEQAFPDHSAFDENGNSLTDTSGVAAAVSGRGDAYASLEFWGGNSILTKLQCFLCLEDDDTPFVELTFFPDQVLRTEDLGRDFVAWMNELKTHLRARRYYCRYENASWDFGDAGPRSGVFWVSDEATPIA